MAVELKDSDIEEYTKVETLTLCLIHGSSWPQKMIRHCGSFSLSVYFVLVANSGLTGTVAMTVETLQRALTREGERSPSKHQVRGALSVLRNFGYIRAVPHGFLIVNRIAERQAEFAEEGS